MTDDDHRAAAASMSRRDVRRRPHKPLLAFDPFAAYVGLLIGIALGAASPTAAPILANAAVQLCIVGALEVGRDGIAECLAP